MKKIIKLSMLCILSMTIFLFGCNDEHEHSYSEWEIRNEATCDEEGMKVRTCLVCDKEETEVIEAKGHNYGEFVIIEEATCDEEGMKVRTCLVCDKEEIEVIEAKGHDIVHVDKKDPSCIDNGNEEYEYCINCSYSTYVEIPATGHSMNGNKCENCDYIIGVEVEKGEYSFDVIDGELISNNKDINNKSAVYTILVIASGTISFEYSVSSEENYDLFEIYLNGLLKVSKSGEVPFTEFKIDVKEGDTLVLKYVKDSSDNDGDDIVIIKNLKIDFSTKIATCTLTGLITTYNIITKESITTITPALGHDLTHHEVFEATCTLEGHNAYDECSRCDYTTYQKTQDALGHDIIINPASKPTCVEKGWDEYETCSRCNHSTYHEIEPLGHDYKTDVVSVTCESDGYTYHLCNRCFHEYTDNIVFATGHNLIYIYPECATCEHGGHDGYEKCTNDGCTYTTYVETSPALGHDLVHYDGIEPTCSASGYADYDRCTRCSYNTYEYLSALGHDYQDWITLSEETCISAAILESHCSRCEHSIQKYDESRPATGHDYGDAYEFEGTDYVQGYKCETCLTCGYVHKFDFTETLITKLFVFKDLGGSYQIVGTNLTEENTIVEIPSEYNGMPVTSIAGSMLSYSSTFSDCDFVTKLIIPDTINYIGYSALSGLYNLEEIVMPAVCDKLKYIFNYSKGYNYDRSYYTNSLKKVTITGTYAIGYEFFVNQSNSAIETIIISDTVPGIGSRACANCLNLKNITLSESFTNLPNDTFTSCSSLNYNVYDNAKYLGSLTNPYKWLISATSTDIESCDIHSNTVYISENAFKNCANLESIEIKNKIIKISANAFNGCSSLTSIEIPDNVLELGMSVFANCTNLTNVELGSGFDSLVGTFNNCSNLTTIVIPDSVTCISGYAFKYCEKLESIYIPKSVVQFGDAYEFYYNKWSLENVYYGGSLEDWINIEMIGTLYGNGFVYCTPLSYAKNLYITNENNEYELLTEIIVPESVTEISEYTYYYLRSVTKVTLHEGITFIDEKSFEGSIFITKVVCPLFTTANIIDLFENVEDLTIIGDVKVIPSRYFYYAKCLKTVYLPDTVEKIESSAFEGCNCLENIYLNDNISIIEESAFKNCSNLNDLHIPTQLTVIENYAFSQTGIEELIIPNNIVEIKENAFSFCDKLTKVIIPELLTNISSGAFTGSVAITDISMPIIGENFEHMWAYYGYYDSKYTPSTLNRVVLYGNQIPTKYFKYFTIYQLILPNTITEFGNYVFNNSKNVIYYMGTIDEWNSIIMNDNYDLQRCKVYYYTDSCIHDKEDCLWTYDEEENITIDLSVIDWSITTSPSCTSVGYKEGQCKHCGETLIEELPMIDHVFENNVCTKCELESYSISNGSYTFVLGSDGIYYSNNYHKNKTTAELTITANVKITITYSYKVSSEEKDSFGYGDFLYIYEKGTKKITDSGNNSYFDTRTVTLYAGEQLKFQYTKDSGTHKYDDRAYFILDSIVEN